MERNVSGEANSAVNLDATFHHRSCRRGSVRLGRAGPSSGIGSLGGDGGLAHVTHTPGSDRPLFEIGHELLNRLEAANRSSELFALLGVERGPLEGGVDDP